ncbi:unnamed protein product [Vicia faba]|uniref:Retrotransposon gag domain-containing protein n=1 Tax=Vicia faba TaxID=3906 RepID=A0AAV1A4A8_VICFA|nr:unnamed protein product [Vicia faba]
MYSASHDDNATNGSILEFQATGAPPSINTYPAVDFRSSASLHQLESIISDSEKLARVVPILRGHTLQWWLQWSQKHPSASWEAFTSAILWCFKPEFREVVPETDEAGESYSEFSNSIFTKLDLEPTKPVKEDYFLEDIISDLEIVVADQRVPYPTPTVMQQQIQLPFSVVPPPLLKSLIIIPISLKLWSMKAYPILPNPWHKSLPLCRYQKRRL